MTLKELQAYIASDIAPKGMPTGRNASSPPKGSAREVVEADMPSGGGSAVGEPMLTLGDKALPPEAIAGNQAVQQAQQQATQPAPDQPKKEEYVWPADKHYAEVARRDRFMAANSEVIMRNTAKRPHNERAAYQEGSFKKLANMAPDFPREMEKRFPRIEEAVQVATKRAEYYDTTAAGLEQYGQIFDQPNPGVSENEHKQSMIREALSLSQVLGNSFGTSNALGDQERKNLTGQLNDSVFQLENLLKTGRSVTESEIAPFRRMVGNMKNQIISKNNSLFNSLAKTTSPEFAASVVTSDHPPSVGGIPVIPRLSRESGPDIEKAWAMHPLRKGAQAATPAQPQPQAPVAGQAPVQPAKPARPPIWTVNKTK